jgi:acetate kinase
MARLVLTLNAGSSSLKYALFAVDDDCTALDRGNLDHTAGDHTALLDDVQTRLKEKLGAHSWADLAAVSHRVVHGGPRYFEPTLATAEVVSELQKLSYLDPEHLPAEIKLIDAAQTHFHGLPQIACFDTAFHRELPRVAQLLPLPRRYFDEGVRRYGFHGLSCQYLMQELAHREDPAARHGRVILAHLGSGASLTAVLDGRSFDTSMGFTPTAGLVMGTRSGDLDPGLVAYLARTEGGASGGRDEALQLDAARFERMINHESGLLGVSGLSGDLRQLTAAAPTNPAAADAVELFCYQARKFIGAYAAALGGLDTLVFAGGIGEHMPAMRERICAGLGFLGITLDSSANAANAALISAPAGQVAVRVIPTDEEIVLARSAMPFLARSPSSLSVP